MAKLDSKKIDSALTNLTNAAKGAVRALNEMSDTNEFKGSTLESDPLNHIGQIVRILQKAKTTAADQAQYEGKTVDEILEMQETARQTELEQLQEKFSTRLAARAAKSEEPAEETEPAGDEQPNGDDDPDKPKE